MSGLVARRFCVAVNSHSCYIVFFLVQELSGWCEEDTYDKLRKQIIELITSKAIKEGG